MYAFRSFRIFTFFLVFTSFLSASFVLFPKALHAEVNDEAACTAADGECISGGTLGGCGTKKNLGRCDALNERICCSKSEPGVIGTAACEADSKQKCSVGENCGSYRDKVGECDTNSLGLTQSCCREIDNPTTPSSDTTTASLTYKTLENLPGFENESTDFPTYLKNLYLLALWIVGICALFMLVIGGFLYLSSAGNTALIGSAKKTIAGALIGLVIALISWLLLNTINPDLTEITLTSLSSSGGGGSGNTSGGNPTPASGDIDKAGCESLAHNSANSQCGLASKEIVSILSCMQGKGVSATIYSLTSGGVGSDQTKSAACCGTTGTPSCPHSKTTCHHGCTYGTKGLSYAADLTGGISASTSDANLCKIAEAAKSCGAGSNIWGPKDVSCNGVSITKYAGHTTHLHISTAGCNH